jgi:hypothetical protein
MQADDFFSAREGLRRLLTTFREAGHDLGMAESELAGLSSAAAALDSPLVVMVIGAKGSGKTSLIETLLGEQLSVLNDQSAMPIVVWRYGTHLADQIENDFRESYRPCSALKEFEFIEVPDTCNVSDPDLLKKAYLIADAVLMVFAATDPWDTESFDFMSDLQISVKRPLASVITNIDQRTEEELYAITEFVESSGNKKLNDQIPAYQISSSGLLSNRENNNKKLLLKWIIKSLGERRPFVNRRLRAELTLAKATNQMAQVLESTAETTKAEEESMLSFDKLVALSQEEMTYDFAEAFEKDLDVLKNELIVLREIIIKSNSLVGNFSLTGSRQFMSQRKYLLRILNKSIMDHGVFIIQKIEKHTKDLDNCFNEGSSNIIEDNTELFSFDDSHEPSFKSWYNEMLDSVRSILAEEIIGTNKFRKTTNKLRYSSILIFLTLLSASVSSWFIYLRMENPFYGFLVVFLLMIGILLMLSSHMRRKLIPLYEEESSAIREKIKEQLTELYSLPIERFYKSYKDANLILRNKYKERSSRRKISSISVSNALETAKNILANPLF